MNKFEGVKKPNKIISYLKKEWLIILITTISGVIFNALMPYVAIFQGRLIDDLNKKYSFQMMIKEIGLFLSLVLIIQVFRFIKRYAVRAFANRTLLSMRKMLFNSSMQEDYSKLINKNTSSLMVKTISDVEYCVEGMRKVTTEVFDTGVLMIAYFVQLLRLDFKVTLLSTMFIPCAMICARLLKKKVTYVNVLSRKQNSYITSLKSEELNNISLYRITSSEERLKNEYNIKNEKLENINVKAMVLSSSLQPLYYLISMLGMIFILLLGGKLVLNNEWTIGTFTAFTGMFIALSLKVVKLLIYITLTIRQEYHGIELRMFLKNTKWRKI